MISDSWKPRLQDVSAFMGAQVRMLRLDEIHPVVSGNKWFKLKENIAAAMALNNTVVVTFGGAYSNHLIATAAAAQQYGLQSIGIVRGEGQYASNPTLSACTGYGMKLMFVSRDDYRHREDPGFIAGLLPFTEQHFLIPEGGSNKMGRKGARQIATWFPEEATHIAIPVGTGTTLAGIMTGRSIKKFLGYCATKECWEQAASLKEWAGDDVTAVQLFSDTTFGGFGKWNETLLLFVKDFFRQTGIPLDLIYTAKMMYMLRQQIPAGQFPSDAAILCVHTGGLQGNPAGLFEV